MSVGEQVGNALVRGIAAGQQLAVEQETLAGLPASDFLAGQRVEVDPFELGAGVHRTSGQRDKSGGSSLAALAIEREVGVPGRGAVGNHPIGLLAACVG